MSYAGKIKINGDEYPIASSLYGTCPTSGGTATKLVTLPNFDALIEGVMVAVRFTYGNTAEAPQLKVNNTDAKPIRAYGAETPGATGTTSWEAEAVVPFVYSGGAWVMLGSSVKAIEALEESVAAEEDRATLAEANITENVTAVRGLCVNRKGSVYLPASGWGGSNPYTQTVTVSGVTVTANSRVDLQPDNTVFSHMYSVGVAAIYIANNNGTLTAYAVAKKPTANLTIQCTVVETVTEGT